MRKVIWTHQRKTWERGRPKLQEVRAVWDDVTEKVAFEEETGRSAMNDVVWTNVQVPEEFLLESARLHLKKQGPPCNIPAPTHIAPPDSEF